MCVICVEHAISFYMNMLAFWSGDKQLNSWNWGTKKFLDFFSNTIRSNF